MEGKTRWIQLSSVLLGLSAGALFPFMTSAATMWRAPEVRVFDQGQQQTFWYAFDQKFEGGASIAVGDLGGDGVSEVVVGAGFGSGPEIRTFRTNGSLIRSFNAYDQNFQKGVNVAMGDLDGDGKDEIITGAGQGGGPQVRVFDGLGSIKFTPGFFAFDSGFRGGVNVAVGDLNGDGKQEILTGVGPGAAPNVRVYDRFGKFTGQEFVPFASTDLGGVSVATGNIDGGQDDEVVMSIYSNGQSRIKVYKANSARTILGEFVAWSDDVRGGVQVSTADIDGDGLDEIVASIRSDGGPQVRVFNAQGTELQPPFFAYEEDFRGGVNVASGDLDGDGQDEIFTTPSKQIPTGRTDLHRYMRVNLDEQKLYAYEDGYLVKSFLISSGRRPRVSPTGEYTIFRKLPVHLYSGPGYYLPGVKWNLSWRPSYYIHGTYWHDNFGHPMSHGCINMRTEEAEWVYNFADLGTTFIVEGVTPYY